MNIFIHQENPVATKGNNDHSHDECKFRWNLST